MIISNLVNKTQRPWAAALFFAIFMHALFILLSERLHWFEWNINTQPTPSNFELILLPDAPFTQPSTAPLPVVQSVQKQIQKTELLSDSNRPFLFKQTEPSSTESSETKSPMALPISTIDESANDIIYLDDQSLDDQNLDSGSMINTKASLPVSQQDPLLENRELDLQNKRDLAPPSFNNKLQASEPQAEPDLTKPDLLNLSNISLLPDSNDETLNEVFSEELRNKIADSKKAQQDYLKGLTKEVDYPITQDADGTRYVNIKGVCWRLPPEGNTNGEGWAIVFDGCGNQNKLFHFELNISPSILTNELLGPDSPFNLDQPIK